MKLRYKLIEIRMQQGASILRKRVPAWEVPVIQAIHPETTEVEDAVHESDPLSVSSEMARLHLAYGAERQEGGITGIPYAAAVYGQHAVGITALRAAMQEAVLSPGEQVTPDEASPSLRPDLIQSLTDTPIDTSDLIGAVAA